MTRDNIIYSIAINKEYKTICNKITANINRRDLGNDLFQEVILILAEYKPEDIERIYHESKGKIFKFFVIRIAYNMVNNKYSSFYKQFISNITGPEDSLKDMIHDVMPDIKREQELNSFYDNVLIQLNTVRKEYGEKFPYDIRMLEGCIHFGGLRKLSRATGIPYQSIQVSVARIRNKIKQNVTIPDFTD